MSHWVAMHCTDEASSLQRLQPNAFLLLALIARRARWTPCPVTKLEPGQAFIGDFAEAGIKSRQAYRHAIKSLTDGGFATFKGTNKGTVATLVDTRVFSVSGDGRNQQKNQQGTNKEPSSNQQGTTNSQRHRDTEDTKTPLPPSADGEGRVLPRNWKKMTIEDQKATRVAKNSPGMIRIGSWFNRRETTPWSVYEAARLALINPSPEEVDLLESYYMAIIEDDYRRRDLPTLLNNWISELDRARAWKHGV